ncbi:hypothetical protein [Methanolobus psychrotolerans]|uniref:hypothetical protein n=1 Tax=Methanolobus psychrotolerans TaxID=1874706 RepID=UPI000B91AD8B|nr:hypothetical protein [Methanolobus psychrotolerans]
MTGEDRLIEILEKKIEDIQLLCDNAGEKGAFDEYNGHCFDISIIEDIIDHVQNADDFDSAVVKNDGDFLIQLIEQGDYKSAHDLFLRY